MPLRPRVPAYVAGLAATLLASPAPIAAQRHAPALARAVHDFDSTLALPDDPGLVHVADFDGDGREDVAAILVASGRRALVVFRAAEDAYEVLPLYSTLPEGTFELRLVPPGRRRVLGSRPLIEFGTPALELVFPGRSSALYVWRRGRFQVFGTESR